MSYVLAEGVRQALLANADLAAIIGTNIWDTYAPAGTCGVWLAMDTISGQQTASHDGNDNLERVRFQFTLGGSDKVQINAALAVLRRDFSAVEYLYDSGTVEVPDVHSLVFLHAGGPVGHIDQVSRLYSPKIDFYVWANY